LRPGGRPLQQPDALGFIRRRSFPKRHQRPVSKTAADSDRLFSDDPGNVPDFRADLLAFAFAELEAPARRIQTRRGTERPAVVIRLDHRLVAVHCRGQRNRAKVHCSGTAGLSLSLPTEAWAGSGFSSSSQTLI